MTHHNKIINDLTESVLGFKQVGLTKALTTAFIAVEDDFGFDVPVTFVPDGYVVDPQVKKVILYEVVCTNDLSKRKVAKVLDFWFDIDSCGWSVELKIVREGGRVVQTLSDEALCRLFYEWDPWLGTAGRIVPSLQGAGRYDLVGL